MWSKRRRALGHAVMEPAPYRADVWDDRRAEVRA